jgi:alanine racemase
MTGDPSRAKAVIDLTAIVHNYRRLEQCGVPVMGVVKADAYGHGCTQVARALRDAGAQWLGVALPAEALNLRATGDRGHLLAWLWAPGDPGIIDCVTSDVDLSISSELSLVEVVAAARRVGRRARVHIKVDTGLSRNGVPRTSWETVFASAASAQEAGFIEIVGLWSHLASADEPLNPSIDEQLATFSQAREVLSIYDVRPELCHLANSAATLDRPDAIFDLVRAGIAIYGVTPGSGLGTSTELGLRPVMTLRARLAHVKRIEPGTAVSYGGSWIASEPTTIGLVPVGYADGIPRAASNVAEVQIGGRRCPVRGVVAMDQFVVDLGLDSGDQPGDDVIVFGPGGNGEPSAEDWARWSNTIGYEIVTRISPRVPREYVTVSDG